MPEPRKCPTREIAVAVCPWLRVLLHHGCSIWSAYCYRLMWSLHVHIMCSFATRGGWLERCHGLGSQQICTCCTYVSDSCRHPCSPTDYIQPCEASCLALRPRLPARHPAFVLHIVACYSLWRDVASYLCSVVCTNHSIHTCSNRGFVSGPHT